MRRPGLTLSILVLALLVWERASLAARPQATDPLPAGDIVELVVFEVDGCRYCQLFRRDVLPTYILSPRAAEVPIRFVDLNNGLAGLKLETPIEVVPTAILVKNNRETGRISGYSGPDSFFQLMRTLLSSVL